MSRPLIRRKKSPVALSVQLRWLWASIQVLVGSRTGAVARVAVLYWLAIWLWENDLTSLSLCVIICEMLVAPLHTSVSFLWGLVIAYANCPAQRSPTNRGLIVDMSVTHFIFHFQPAAALSCLQGGVGYDTSLGNGLFQMVELGYRQWQSRSGPSSYWLVSFLPTTFIFRKVEMVVWTAGETSKQIQRGRKRRKIGPSWDHQK